LFNDIQITRRDSEDNLVQTLTVPIAYGPIQKFLARVQQDPDLSAPAMQLPRMSFEIVNISYDGQRKLTSSYRSSAAIPGDNSSYSTVLNPTPYNIEFQLSIMSKYLEDGSKIIEQIIPFFKPEFTPSVKLLDDPECYLDVPIILNDISMEDTYEADFQQRRAIIWTLNFSMKAWYFGPSTNKKIIKFVEVKEYTSTTATDFEKKTTVQPGLTANGAPTNDINETIPYADINFEDDWGYIVRIEDN